MWSDVSNSFVLRELKSNRRNVFITVSVLGCVIVAFFFAYAAFGTDRKALHSTLLSVQILFRHGDRTPTFFFPKDPHFNHSWPDGEGVLTNKGKQQLYRLGKFLRTFYSGFLPELYSSKELLIKSSSSPRCQMSAGALLAGLYPPVGPQIWNSDLLWQPIPVNPIPRDQDKILIAKTYCPAYEKEKKKSDEILTKKLTEEQKSVFPYASHHTGVTIANFSDAEPLYYTLKIEEDNGLKLPEWTKKIYPEPLRTLGALNLASFTGTDLLKRLKSGPLLEEWLSNIENYKRNQSPLLFLYSAHDITIVNTMRSLGLMSDYTWFPDYGSSLVLEFHKEVYPDRSPFVFVKFLYLNSTSSENFNELTLPNCGVKCPLEEFKAMLKSLIPQDLDKECQQIS